MTKLERLVLCHLRELGEGGAGTYDMAAALPGLVRGRRDAGLVRGAAMRLFRSGLVNRRREPHRFVFSLSQAGLEAARGL